MKLASKKVIAACALVFATTSVIAAPATSEKHANKANEIRQSVFSLLAVNMGPLGGMAKGKVPFDAKVVEKNAVRMNQFALMIADYTSTDTRAYKVDTASLPGVWADREVFEKKIDDLIVASEKLVKVSTSGDESAIKAAIGGVGKTCGSCHDDFKED